MPTVYYLCAEHTKYFSYFKGVCLFKWQHATSLSSQKIMDTLGYMVLILDYMHSKFLCFLTFRKISFKICQFPSALTY